MKKAVAVIAVVAVIVAGGFVVKGQLADKAETVVTKEIGKDGGAKVKPVNDSLGKDGIKNSPKVAGKDGGEKVRPDSTTTNHGVVPKGEPTEKIKTVVKSAK